MDRQAAMAHLLNHYEHPRNRGDLTDPAPQISISGGNPGCGDMVQFALHLDEQQRVDAVRWDGEGCTIHLAAASILSEKLQGLTVEQIEAIPYETFVDELGRELVKTRPTCATVGLSTLKQGVHDYRMRQRLQK